MASSRSDDNLSEETFDFICTACAKENVIKEAIKYCVECKGYCCTFCVNIHKKFPQLDEHNLLDISTSQQADETPRLPSFPTERCSIHQGKVIDMYCGDHDAVGCYACIAIDHKNCSGIHSIPDDIDNISKDEEFDKKVDNLQTRTESLKTILHKANEVYLKNLENAKHNALLAITEQRRETDAKLDRLEENVRSEVHSQHNVLKSQLLNASQRVESALNTYVEFGDKMKRAECNKSQKFVCSKLFCSTINKDCGDIDNVDTELEIFSRDNVLSFVGNVQQLEQLGVVTVSDKTGSYKLKQCQDINVKVQDDSNTCTIWGCCLYNDTTLLITDRNNKKLKRVNVTQLSVEDYISLPYSICGVCCCQNDEVAVGCWNNNIIQFVSMGQTMTLSRQMKLTHRCYHVAYMDGKLYVSDDNGGSVHIYDMVGTLLQTIFKDASGNKLFTTSVQIAIWTPGDKMFVTAFSGGLVLLDKKGKHNATVKDSDIDGADGVCVDGRGNVFVAGRNSNKVVQLGYNGKKRGVILKEEHGIKQPLSLCFKPNICKLFVTMRDNDIIKVFDLE